MQKWLSNVLEQKKIKSEGLTTESRRAYRTGQDSYENFAKEQGRKGLPASAISLEAYIAWAVNRDRQLDSSSLRNYINGIAAYHPYFKEVAGRRATDLEHPLEATALRRMLEFVKKNHKLASKAKRPLTWAEVKGMVERGFDTNTCRGLHSRLLWILCTFGMLRRGAATRLRISYRIRTRQDGTRYIEYLKGSDILVDKTEEGRRYITFKVEIDKNVDSRKVAWGVIPDYIEKLGLRPVEILEDYLMTIKPPSLHAIKDPELPRPRGAKAQKGQDPEERAIDGLLLAFPNFMSPYKTEGRTFHRVPYTSASTAFKDMFKRAFPGTSKEELFYIGSHSGRKTLAEFIWTMSGDDIRVVADFGKWKLDRGAVERYFSTPLYERLAMLVRLDDPQKVALG